jgi:hypothetical protein
VSLSDSIFPCDECGRTYNHVLLNSCPECQVTSGSGSRKYEIDPDRKAHLEIIGAQAKTTHAMRAAVIILRFFMLNLFLIGLWVIFGTSNNVFLIVINCILWLIGAIRTLYLASEEFKKSE